MKTISMQQESMQSVSKRDVHVDSKAHLSRFAVASPRFAAGFDCVEGYASTYLPARIPAPASPSPELRGCLLGGWRTTTPPVFQV
mgnify:CR=1 FL=1